ncbi:endonuclease/exonuclease/phosphatase family protein [Arthrobacter sp. NamB2]|uniref:endonuclease/exonuclease/phosphatase family protein n=1 Tax=Arthrobacter sp. NamB2 TaxID=2576035 RepID=UPI0010C9F6C9|nr:endonuclease/exonuclease/phosphatase family protein [Arthrobacter sp. NamB2]TKV28884.1 endonuclease/exonuclease/phosphatase family protein [Arthrobacter sp. NamB2]
MRVLARCSAGLLAVSLLVVGAPGAFAGPPDDTRSVVPDGLANKQNLRIATYNASLNRSAAGELVRDLGTPENAQARAIAEVLQITRPEVVLLNEFDYDAGGTAADLFKRNYLRVSQNGKAALDYPYVYTAPSNTGVPSGLDLNNDGTVGGAEDALGFGAFEGQYGMVIYSQYPIQTESVRTFQHFLWKDMPGALLPDNPATAEQGDWYSEAELDVLPLSSKSHWDVPLSVGGKTVHVLASHPTPPVFDGKEDRNGRRNSDEIRFWSDYVTGGPGASYIYDDGGVTGGLKRGDRFVILGDQNSDPLDGDSLPGAIDQLLGNKLVQDPQPSSSGATEAAALQGGANAAHRSDPRFDTADFEDRNAGNIRADYVLPSRTLRVSGSGVFWPRVGSPGSELTGIFPFPTSDHRLVYADIVVSGTKQR